MLIYNRKAYDFARILEIRILMHTPVDQRMRTLEIVTSQHLKNISSFELYFVVNF